MVAVFDIETKSERACPVGKIFFVWIENNYYLYKIKSLYSNGVKHIFSAC